MPCLLFSYRGCSCPVNQWTLIRHFVLDDLWWGAKWEQKHVAKFRCISLYILRFSNSLPQTSGTSLESQCFAVSSCFWWVIVTVKVSVRIWGVLFSNPQNMATLTPAIWHTQSARVSNGSSACLTSCWTHN